MKGRVRTIVYPDGYVVQHPVNDNPRGRKITPEERNKPRRYRMSFKVKRKLSCAVVEQYFQAVAYQCNHIFFTLTLPEDEVNYFDNTPMNRFRDNMLKRDFLSLVWTRELTKKGIPHWHCLAVAPYVFAGELQKAWCSASDTTFHEKACSFRTDGGWQVRNLDKSVSYLSKYMSKCEDESDHKLYGISGIKPLPAAEDFNLRYFKKSIPIHYNEDLNITIARSYLPVPDSRHFCKWTVENQPDPSKLVPKKPEKKPKKPDNGQIRLDL